MVNKGGGGDIGVQVVVTDGVDNSFWNKILKRVQKKKVQNTVLHTST